MRAVAQPGGFHEAAVPATGHHWRPTCQPVVLEAWHPAQPQRGVLTTVTHWTSNNEVVYHGHTYGQKDIEFLHWTSTRPVGP